MNLRLIIISVLISFSVFLLATTDASANEGVLELRNTIGGPSRCWASSILMPDFNYNISVTCRDLIYPVSSEVLTYVVWATPATGGDAFKLGELQFGKVAFKTKNAFTSIFVTQERDDNKNLKAPSGSIAMRGNIQPISFLEDVSQAQAPLEEESFFSPVPTSPTSGGTQSRGISNILRGGGIITAISVFLIILMLILVKPFK